MALEDAGPLLSAEQLREVLARFGVGVEDGGSDDGPALVRLRLSYAVLGAVEAHMLRAQSAALEDGEPGEDVISAAGAAFGGADATQGTGPLWLLQARIMSTLAGLTCLEPDPRGPAKDAVLDAAALAAAASAGLIGFRRAAASGADEDSALVGLAEAAANLRRALTEIDELLAVVETLRRTRPSRN